MKHNESECRALHPAVEFTVRAYYVSKGALEFEAWFKDKFTLNNPGLAEGFMVSRHDDPEGQEVIEFTSFDTVFDTRALEAMFESYREDEAKKTIEKAKLSVVNRVDLN